MKPVEPAALSLVIYDHNLPFHVTMTDTTPPKTRNCETAGLRRLDKFAQAKVFVELVKAGSLSSAAERLGLANSAVSRRLKELVERLGAQLICAHY